MKNSNIVLLAFTMFFLTNCAGTGEGAVADGTPITSQEMQPLANWVVAQTGGQIPVMPVAIASGMQLKTTLGLEGVRQARSVAAYVPGRIIINNVIWDPTDVVSQSYLVHELVHHAQLFSGKTYPCPEAKEREAYTLQNKFLVEHGESPVVDQDWIDEMSTCRVSSRQLSF